MTVLNICAATAKAYSEHTRRIVSTRSRVSRSDARLCLRSLTPHKEIDPRKADLTLPRDSRPAFTTLYIMFVVSGKRVSQYSLYT